MVPTTCLVCRRRTGFTLDARRNHDQLQIMNNYLRGNLPPGPVNVCTSCLYKLTQEQRNEPSQNVGNNSPSSNHEVTSSESYQNSTILENSQHQHQSENIGPSQPLIPIIATDEATQQRFGRIRNRPGPASAKRRREEEEGQRLQSGSGANIKDFIKLKKYGVRGNLGDRSGGSHNSSGSLENDNNETQHISSTIEQSPISSQLTVRSPPTTPSQRITQRPMSVGRPQVSQNYARPPVDDSGNAHSNMAAPRRISASPSVFVDTSGIRSRKGINGG